MKTADSILWKLGAGLALATVLAAAPMAVADVYLGLDGGLEGTATVDNSATNVPTAGKWVKGHTDLTIAEETTLVRSGAKSIRLLNTSTSGRRVYTPLTTFGSKTTSVTIQYYRMITNTTSFQSNQVGVLRATEALQGTYARPAAINTWEKHTYTPASATFSSLAGVIMNRASSSGAGSMYIDDLCVYDGAVDTTAPNSAGAVTITTNSATELGVSWGAASGGVDSGGYLVVRYASSPAASDDPNVNGIYAVGNTIPGTVNGTVVYQGTGTSFNDTGLTTDQTYYYKVYTYDKAYNYATESTESGTPAEAPSGAPAHWTALYNRGAPVFSYYLGDSLAYQFEFAVNTDTAGWTVEYGLGKTTGGSGWTWRSASWSRMDGENNRVWISNQDEQQFTSTGDWYYAGRFITADPYTYYVATDWVENTAGALAAESYFTVNALENPSEVSAAKDGVYSATRVDLGWTQWNSKNVLITRSTAVPTGSPEQGTAYSANDTFGNQTVVAGSQSGGSLEVAGLVPGQTYYFTFYSENYGYYSAGVTTDPVALDMPQARNTSGGSPEAPAGTIYLGDSNLEFGFDSWGELDGNWGSARLWLRYNNASIGGGTSLGAGDFTDAEHKTMASGLFNQIGTWYWGFQMDYGAPYGTGFWYKVSNADWTGMATTDAGATLTVTVSPINNPSGQTATRSGDEPGSAIDLAWSKNAQDKDVMIVRKLASATWTEPTQGQDYEVDGTIGSGTVIYNGSGTTTVADGLEAGETYDFKFYSVNNYFYSEGVTAQASTRGCAPDAPTGVHAAETNLTAFTAAWEAAEGATGYRLDVSTSASFANSSGADYTVDFEGTGETNTSYAGRTMSLGGLTWYTTNALIGDSAFDWKNGSRSLRMRGFGTSAMTLMEDLPNGLGTLSFNYRRYSTDTQVDWMAEYSTDGGENWTQIGSAFTAPASDVVQVFSETVNVPGAVRVRIKRATETGTSNARLNMDDLVMTPAIVPSFVEGYANLAVADTSQLVEGLEEGSTYYFRVRAEGEGGCPSENSATASVITRESLKIVLNRSTINVREGGTARFYARLNQNPGATVNATVARNAGSEALSVSGLPTVTFNTTDWHAWRPITLFATADENSVNETATFEVWAAETGAVTIDATALDGDGLDENIALAASGSTISGFRGGAYASAIDGIYDSRSNYAYTLWTNPVQGYMTLDLKRASTISRIRLMNWDWDDRAQSYKIESSANGTDWSVLVNASGRMGWDDWDVGSHNTRYLRFTGLANSLNKGICIPEWEVYGSRPPLPQPEIMADNVLVRENGEGRFYVRMDSAVTENVTVTVAWHDGDAGLSVAPGSTTVTFKPSDWFAWRPVTLLAADDANTANETAQFIISGAGAADQFVTVSSLDDDGLGENIALAASGTTASGWRGGGYNLVNDGLHTVRTNYAFTLWTNVAKGYITLDLQRPAAVSRIRLLNWDWDERAQRYQIEGSLNGTDWTLLVNATAQDYQGWDDWQLDDENVRYLRFTGTTNSVNKGICVAEWEVYGVRQLPDLLDLSKDTVLVRENGEGRFYVRLKEAPQDDVNVTVVKTGGDADITLVSGGSLWFTPANWNAWQAVTLTAAVDEDAERGTATFDVVVPGVPAQSVTAVELDSEVGVNLAAAGRVTGGFRGAQAIDGLHADRANYAYVIATNDPPGALRLDLRSSRALGVIRVLNWDWTYRTHRYTLEYSDNGTDWTMLVDASSADRQGWDEWSVDVSARYLRLTGLSNSANAIVCIPEWEVYGPEARPLRRSAPAGEGFNVLESRPVSVLTSEGIEDETGWLAVDGDPETAWVGQKTGGGYLVVEFAPTLTLQGLQLDVTTESLADAQILTSLDAEEWQPLPENLEENPVSLNFLWVVFQDDGTDAVPEVLEIWTNP
jgi:hypothetical protein